MNAYQNILVIRTDRIGDVVLTTPAIKALRQHYPASRISVLVSPLTVDLVSGNPYIDEILVDDRPGANGGVFGFLRLVESLRARRFDLAVVFHTKRRYNLACFLGGIPFRLGYKNDKFGFLLNMPVKDLRPLGSKHEAQYCLDVLKTLGIFNEPLDLMVPLQKQAEDWVAGWMETQRIVPNGMILIHAGSSDAAKCWPAAEFASLMDMLYERYGCKLVLIGSAQTAPVAGAILSSARHAGEFVNMAGKTSLAQTVSLIRHASLLISNDSGPVHVAAAVGCNVISLFVRDQPGINPERWRPLGAKSHVLLSGPGGQPGSFKAGDVLEVVEKILLKDDQYEIF